MFVVQSFVTLSPRVTQVQSPLPIFFRRLLVVVLLPARELVVHQVIEAVPMFPFDGVTACVFAERASILVEIPNYFKVTRNCSAVGCGDIPRAPVLMRPLEYFQISITAGGVIHHTSFPRAPVLSQPHQTVQPVMYRRPLGCACIECAPRVSFSNPLEDVQVAAADTQEPVQIAQASFFLQPLHDFQSSIPTCLGTRPLTPRASFLPQKLQHFIVAYLRSTHAENLWVTKQTIRI